MTAPEHRAPELPATRRARLLLAGVLLSLFLAMLLARALGEAGLEQTALFYVGVPALVAVTVTLTARPRTAVGVALATTTIGLALAGPLLDEGVVCLVIAAPLLYGVAAAVGVAVQRVRERGPGGRAPALVAAPLLAVMLLEGVGGVSLLPREDAGSASVVVDASVDEVATALASAPDYGPFRSAFLRAVPFPHPVHAAGAGLEVGAVREVEFTPRRSLGIGAEPTPRAMALEVVRSEARDDGGAVVFAVTDDTTLARWMDLHQAEVIWWAEGTGVRVTWTLRYTRTFDPSWYFGPVQRYATDQAAAYLAATFTPDGAR
ncbi:hypothetical protein DNL40_13410 [Xylanimonas oleitrophica]|uniref:Polyketide cyclase / dehydrase and lipid transport n=1 Tax=Xylanimonas oleitrophica TaxID=2607479 RepID=A0A2W5WM64_9MICO|nr:hypothetical protein DNL40_13410 [Xylanimonas oleitrophica]